MFYFHKVEYVQYLGEVDIFHTWLKEVLPIYDSAKIIQETLSSADEKPERDVLYLRPLLNPYVWI